MRKNISEEARRLYHPSDDVVELTLLIENLIENEEKVAFPYGFKIDGLSVNFVEIDEFSHVLVHWHPNFSMSTQNDPYCAALILKPKDLRRIYREVARIIHD